MADKTLEQTMRRELRGGNNRGFWRRHVDFDNAVVAIEKDGEIVRRVPLRKLQREKSNPKKV